MAYNRLAKYATTVTQNGPETVVTYHSTAIVRADLSTVRLDTGGLPGQTFNRNPNHSVRATGTAHGSVTTKKKMNQASYQFDLCYRVYQERGQWFVTTKAGTYLYQGSVFTFDRTTGQPIGE